jgi:hypothetical protein
MTELDPQELRRELVLRQAIDGQLDALVRKANVAATLFEGSRDMEESQFRNLLNVAVVSESAEVVINFIRYQMGRSGRSWTYNDAGHKVIADIRWLLSELVPNVRTSAETLLQKSSDAERAAILATIAGNQADIHVRLIQLYLGYLSRAFYYGKKTGKFSDLKEVISVE